MQYKYPKGRIRPTAAAGVLLSFNLDQEFKHVNEQVSTSTVLTREYYETPLITENYGAFISLGADWNLVGKQHLGLDLRYHFFQGNHWYRCTQGRSVINLWVLFLILSILNR